MLVTGRRLMRRRLQENYQVALGELEKAENSGDKKNINRVKKEVQRYAPREEEKSAHNELVRRIGRSQVAARDIVYAELGDKVAPLTKYCKMYNDKQLYNMYLYVGKYASGLPAFGPNILRTVHVTTVMTACYKLGIPSDDARVVNHFALARHGEYERRRA